MNLTAPPSSLPLIRTKLAPPQGVRLISRDRLMTQLDAERERKLILFVGPAGCGKTCLATLWRKSLVTQGHSVVWYNLGADDHLAEFSAYLLAGLATIAPGIGDDARAYINRAGTDSFDPFVGAVINDLLEYEKPVYIVLEDFHAIANSPIRGVVDKLLQWAPPNLHLLITSRVSPPLSLSLLRGQDQVAELDFRVLRFDVYEAEALLQSQGLEALNRTQVRTIHGLTDGWAVGLQLLAYSLRNAKEPQPLEALAMRPESGGGNYVAEYFEQCVSPNLSKEELSFLVRSSTCRRFNRELCELITANPRSGELLKKFEHENLFLMSIESDDAEPWYRFHRLFAKYLNDRLRHLAEDELTTINAAAGRWFAGKGLYAEAIRHLRYAGDTVLCLELIERVARPMVGAGEYLMVRDWVRKLPRDTLLTRLELLLCAVWAELGSSRLDDLGWMFDAIAAHPDADEPHLRCEVALLRGWYLLKIDDTAGTLALVSPYENLLSDIDPLVAFGVRNVLAVALAHAAEFERARDLESPAGQNPPSEGRLFTPVIAYGAIAFSFLAEGAFRQANVAMTKGFSALEGDRAGLSEFAGLTAGFQIAALYGQNDLAGAESLLFDYLPMIELIALPDCLIHALISQARLLRADGRIDAALRSLDNAEKMGTQLHLERLNAWSLAERVTLEAAQANLPAAGEALRQLQRLAQGYETCQRCAWAEIPFAAAWAASALAAMAGDHTRTLALSLPLIKTCDALGKQSYAAHLRLRCAVALAASSNSEDDVTAFEMIQQALAIAAPHRMLRIFLDEGSSLLPLLQRYHPQADKNERSLIDELLRAAASSPPPAAPEPRPTANVAAGDVSLSPRELEIVELISRAFSNKSIARALNCSSGTVKWHLKNVFLKLDAVSREDAAVKARALKLLP